MIAGYCSAHDLRPRHQGLSVTAAQLGMMKRQAQVLEERLPHHSSVEAESVGVHRTSCGPQRSISLEVVCMNTDQDCSDGSVSMSCMTPATGMAHGRRRTGADNLQRVSPPSVRLCHWRLSVVDQTNAPDWLSGELFSEPCATREVYLLARTFARLRFWERGSCVWPTKRYTLG